MPSPRWSIGTRKQRRVGCAGMVGPRRGRASPLPLPRGEGVEPEGVWEGEAPAEPHDPAREARDPCP